METVSSGHSDTREACVIFVRYGGNSQDRDQVTVSGIIIASSLRGKYPGFMFLTGFWDFPFSFHVLEIKSKYVIIVIINFDTIFTPLLIIIYMQNKQEELSSFDSIPFFSGGW